MIECTMTTVKKRTTTKKHRHQQACEQVIVPAVGIGTINEGGNPVSSGATFGTRCRKNEDLMVPPPKLSWSSKPTSSSSFNDLALESNKHSIIMAPENNEREVTTNGRRSDRLSKSNNRTIAIGSTSLKINVQVNSFINENFSPLCVKKKASGSTSIKKNVQVNSSFDGNFSPLCVKKKMSRRTRIHKEGRQDLTHPKCTNSNKKLPLTKVNVALIDTTENEMEGNAILSNDNRERDALQPVTKKCVSFSKCTPHSDVVTTINRADQDCGTMAQKEDMVVKKCVSVAKCTSNADSLATANRVVGNHQMTHKCGVEAEREDVLTNESILFEASPDFWNSFLLDTYRQIAFNNPDIPDFEPIPYAISARGIPVEPENIKDSKAGVVCNAPTTDSTGKAMTTSSSNPKQTRPPVKQKLQDKACATAKLVDIRDGDHSADPNNVVGPDSWQMDVINRMLYYLDCETNHPHSTYRKQIRDIKEVCTKRHIAGSLKYRHLPGAIFDQVVKTIGGSTFLSIYKAAKCLSYGRLESDSCVPVEKEGAPSNLIQFAVGYGYYMAKTTTHKRQKICPDMSKANGIQDTTEICAQTVLNMSDDSRLSFWNEYILTIGDN